jgi:hypothetical protein
VAPPSVVRPTRRADKNVPGSICRSLHINSAPTPRSGLFPRYLLSLLTGLGKTNGDRLFSTLDLPASAARSALGLPLFVAMHLILDIAARAFGIFALPLLDHRTSFQSN